MENNFPIDAFFGAGFERSAEYTSAAGTKSIKVLFDEKFSAAKLLGNELEATNPIVTCRTVDVLDADHSSKVTLKDTEYSVIEVMHQGDGFTYLKLSHD